MEGYVFGEGCVPEPSDPIPAECYQNADGNFDIRYVGPADTLGNIEVWSTMDGSCGESDPDAAMLDPSGYAGFPADWAIVAAADEAEAIAKCEALKTPELPDLGNVFNFTTAGWPFPVEAWLCIVGDAP
jgi:hypothetical protein